jgi:hypothetical protein
MTENDLTRGSFLLLMKEYRLIHYRQVYVKKRKNFLAQALLAQGSFV